MKIFWLILLVSALAVTGCGTTDRDKIEKAVWMYNEKLPEALKSSVQVLKDVATEMEQGRVEIFISQMRDEKTILDAKLTNLIVKNISVRKIEAKDINNYKLFPVQGRGNDKTDSPYTFYDQVEGKLAAEEIWVYRYLDLETGKPKGPQQKLGYQTAYTLARKDGKWYVADIDFTEEKLDPVNDK